MSVARDVSGFDQYRKTCSIMFGNASASQLRYLDASIELQQAALTSCDGIIANQLRWLESYVTKNKRSSAGMDMFLKNYASAVNMGMNLISMSYDYITINIKSFTKYLDFLNKGFFVANKEQGELEDIPISKG
jgi:hypothetical protein